jgi:hypothetical protein
MSDTTLLFLALAAATLGMASLALGISAHWRQLFGDREQSAAMRLTLRVIGSVLLATALAVCIAADPFMMAILVWPMLLMVGAGLVAGSLTVLARTRGPGGPQRALRDRATMEAAE